MSPSNYFSQTYEEARSKFRQSAQDANAIQKSYQNPGPGANGEDLTCDIAWFGDLDAECVLVTFSATHGAEGFCGSGVQVGWFESGLAAQMPKNTALLAIHAINPHGFSWLRRVTEENVDLNRNFINFSEPAPENQGYDEIAHAIEVKTWDEGSIAQANKIIDAYGETYGNKALQQAISGGQYRHPKGIFYGGTAPTWAHKTLKQIFSSQLKHAKRIAVIDYHTGLGPRGYGERICVHAPESKSLARANDWYGGDLTSPALGTSSSVELSGFNVIGMEEALGSDKELTAVALEFGTQPTPMVRLALRADNWLHHHGDLKSSKAQEIKKQIRDAFYQDDDDWKELIWERGIETQRQAIRGLIGG